MRKTRIVTMIPLIVLVLVGVGAVGADTGGRTVFTRGDEVLMPNILIRSDLRFSPGRVGIDSGEMMTWVHADKTLAPHTMTLATPEQLVENFEDFLFCGECAAAIGAALAGHFPPGLPPVPVLDPDGDGEYGTPADSLLIFPGETVSAQINSAAGTTLLYFCAIHPWMQGSIEVN